MTAATAAHADDPSAPARSPGGVARRLSPRTQDDAGQVEESVFTVMTVDTTASAWVPHEGTKVYRQAHAQATRRLEALDRDERELASARWFRLARGLERPVLLRRAFVTPRELDLTLLPPLRKLTVAQVGISPLRELLHRGRSGEVPLKVYLAALAGIGTNEALEEPAPAKDAFLAEAFGLRDPANAGRQRVRTARAALVEVGLLDPETNAVRGRRARLRPMHEAGLAWPYYVPKGRAGVDPVDANLDQARAVAAMLLGDDVDEERRERAARMLAHEDRYLRIEREVFSNGWITVLSGTALAVLLILLQEATRFGHVRTKGGKSDPAATRVVSYKPLWLGEAQRHSRYGITRTPWATGIAELVAWGLVNLKRDTETRDPADDDGDQFRPNRHRYRLSIARMRRSVGVYGPEPVLLATT